MALCLLFCLSGNAQQASTVNRAAAKEKTVGKRILIGTVIDAGTGDALIGVNVKVKGMEKALLPIWTVNSLSV